MTRLAICTAALLLMSTTVGAQQKKQDRVSVGQLVTIVQQALQDTANSTDGLPPLATVSLTLTTTAEKTARGNMEVFVKVGGGVTTGTTQQVTIDMKPPERQKGLAGEPATATVYKELKSVLVAAAESAKAAKMAGTRLAVTGYSAQIGFDVKSTTEGGISFKIGPISISGGASATQAASNKIAVTFK